MELGYILLLSSILASACFAEEDSSEYGIVPGARKTSCPCGRLNKNQARIVGGKETEINEFPFIAGIRTLFSPHVFCGGTIISEYHVLTAAHCTEPRRHEEFAVILGDHNVYDTSETKSSIIYNVKTFIEHELYDKLGRTEYDIALLITEKQINFNLHIEPACFPNAKINLLGQRVKVIGWGAQYTNGPHSDILRKVNLDVVDLKKCDEYFTGIDTANPSQICTHTPNADSCQGDSGGPVVWRDPETNRYTLIGVVSYGDVCGKSPGVNTDVFYHREWINKHMMATSPSAKRCIKI
uniref:Venom s1 protease 16 n=1 Tax=Pristhesancus plagipennis TaxID=1955184 RepID=A0A1Q1NPG2_PRIPG|nr:venom s1 protease 16 [Pristhesancus plagipennis]